MLAEGDYSEDPVEDILYGERRSNGNYWRPRNQNQGYQNQQRGYQNMQRFPDNQGGQRQYQNDKPQQGFRDGGYRGYQSKGLVQRIEELDPQSRKDVLEELKRKFYDQNSTSIRSTKVVYKVEEPEDDDEDNPRKLEHVQLVDRAFLAKMVEKENIIVDTGSNYNLI